MWDLGWELFEIVVPGRLPADLDYTADAHLGDVLDFQSRGLPYGESYVELGKRLGAYESLVVHRYIDSPDAAGSSVHEPIALLVFFSANWGHRAVSRLWRYAYGWAPRRPRRQQVRRVDASALPGLVSAAGSEADDSVRVLVDAGIMGGVRCIRGTRIPVVTALRTLA